MQFFKKKSVIGILIVIVFIIGFFIYRGATKKPEYQTVLAKKGEIVQEVSATGKIKSADSVDLAFDTSGRVGRIYVKVGDKVYKGQTLMALSNAEASAALMQAQANLEGEQARLGELRVGSRPEEIQIAQTTVLNAERALSDAENNLIVVENKAGADLLKSYDSFVTALQSAVLEAKSSLLALTDLQFKYFTGSTADEINIADKKGYAVEALLGGINSGRLATEDLSKLSGGAYALVAQAVVDYSEENVDSAYAKTIDVLQKTKEALDVIPILTSFTSTEKTSLSTEKTSVATSITDVALKNQTVKIQKASNGSAIASAQASVNTAKNTLASAKDSLLLTQAGYTSQQIAKQEAIVKSAQANLRNYQAQYSKTLIVSPIAGVVTKQDAKLGEIVSMASPIVSVISEAKFQTEVYIPEVDVAKLKIGNPAKITLDAYGSSENFDASIASVEPGETVIEGVSTYKTILQFDKDDQRIKSGMTANVDITTDTREGVIVLPARAVISEDGRKIVKVLKNGEVKEKEVVIGIRGVDGNVEITGGLEEGEEVVI